MIRRIQSSPMTLLMAALLLCFMRNSIAEEPATDSTEQTSQLQDEAAERAAFNKSMEPVKSNLRKLFMRQMVFADSSGSDTLAYNIVDEDEKPLLSWRYTVGAGREEDDGLGLIRDEEIDPDQPWDSEHNKRVLDNAGLYEMTPDKPTGKTRFLMISGPGTAYDGKPTHNWLVGNEQGKRVRHILVIMVGPDRAVPWTQPADFVLDLKNPKRGLGQPEKLGYLALMLDGAVEWIPASISDEEFIRLCQLPKEE